MNLCDTVMYLYHITWLCLLLYVGILAVLLHFFVTFICYIFASEVPA